STPCRARGPVCLCFSRASGPASVTRPMTSWPRIAGVLRDAPFVVQDREIGVTQAAVFDGDFNILGPERFEISGFEHHQLFSRLSDPCLIIHRVSYSGTSAGLDGGWLVVALG